VTMFAFLEIAMMTAAFRARRNMKEFGAAGIEGAAVWALSGLSAVLSSLDAQSGAEAVFRLAAPLVAAWLWHRGLGLERRRATGRAVHWRLTAERVLVWLGLAEPSARAASDVDVHRRIARLARAAKRLRELRASGAAAWRQELARRRLGKALEAAVEHAGLASDPARQDQMRDQIGALNAAESLASLDAAAPWDGREAEAAEIARIRQEAAALVAAAGQDRDQAADEAAQAAEIRIQAAAEEAARVRADAAQLTGAVRARVGALEQSQADLRARAELAERELEAARAHAAELSEAVARAESRADQRAEDPAEDAAGEADRDVLVAELAAGILTAAWAGEKWRPDYEALMERTKRSRRWCEYLVRDARNAVFGPGGQALAGGAAESARQPQGAEPPADPVAESRAGADADNAPDRAGELVPAGSP
jgi:hypothetical protein